MEFECGGRTFSRQNFDNLRTESPNLFKWCIDLVQENVEFRHSKSEYLPWSKKTKISELEDPKTRVIVIFEHTGNPVAFVSYQMGTEDLVPHLYLYELHVVKGLRSFGLGSCLVKIVEGIGRADPEKCRKIILTAFKPLKHNRMYRSPIEFYHKHGFKLDPTSPSQCLKARDAAVYDYEIMSKDVI